MLNNNSFGDMVRDARQECKLTMAELGERVGRSKNQIYDLEKGRTLPDGLELVTQLAYILQVDVSQLCSAYLASRNQLPSTQERALDLMSSHMIASQQQEEGGMIAAPMTRKAIQKDAETLAKTLFARKVEEGSWIPVMHIYDAPGLLSFSDKQLPRIEAGHFPSKADDSVEGKTFYDSEEDVICVQLREDVFNQAKRDMGRARFSAAHELAHGILHHELLIQNGGRQMFRDSTLTATMANPEVKPFENPEWQANVWAAAFLMPLDAVRNFIQKIDSDREDRSLVELVATQFKVSLTAADLRVQELAWSLSRP